jgi:hypothetical protein
MTVFTGIIFLNMGFFLMEVRLLGLDKDRALMENISGMLAGAAFEEERDCSTQSSGSGFAEEEYLMGHRAKNYSGCYYLISERCSILSNHGSSEQGYLKKFSPPPEV